jgi:hypothetical protein
MRDSFFQMTKRCSLQLKWFKCKKGINQALHAGCDFILWCHPDESIDSVLSELPIEMIDQSKSYQKVRPSKDLFDQNMIENGIQELNALLNRK